MELNKQMKMKKKRLRLALWIIFFSVLCNSMQASAKNQEYLIKVNRKMSTVTIYEKNEEGKFAVPIKSMLCSAGKDTPLGTFYTPEKYRWKVLQGNVWGQYSTRITDGILFHSVWYYSKDPATVSVKEFNRLGTVCSHGCVRLKVSDVKWIYDNCKLGTKVVIYDSNDPGPLGKPNGVKIPATKKMGYDPSDIWTKSNPYNEKKTSINGVENQTVQYGEKVNLMKGIKGIASYGDDITNSIQKSILFNGKKVSKVDTTKVGSYKVTYRLVDLLNKKVEKQAVIKVIDNSKPVINAEDIIYTNKEDISDALDSQVTALWHDEDVTDHLEKDVEVISNEEGWIENSVQLSIEVKNGKKAKKKVTVYQDYVAPILAGVKDTFISEEELTKEKALEGISVTDNSNHIQIEDIEVLIEKQTDGEWKVIYKAIDQAGNISQQEAIYRQIKNS